MALKKPRPAPNLVADEELPSAPRQKRSRKKRELLLLAGLDLFREKGFEATTVDEIVGKAGVATGGFYKHFTNKTQLLLVLMQNLLDELGAIDLRFQIAASPRAALQKFLEQAFARDLAHAGALRAWKEAVSADVRLAQRQVCIQQWTTERVHTALQRLLRLPGARRNVDVRSLAELMDRLFWQILGEAAHVRRKDTARLVRAAAHLLFHALFTDPAPGSVQGKAGL